MHILRNLFCSLVMTLCCASVSAAEIDEATTVLVLDGSGSMWGQIDGTAKITIARDVIGAMLNDWDPGASLGLMVYGHRVKGDCDDIEMVIPIGSLDAAKFQEQLQKVNPKGMTPLSASVRRAAELLDWRSEAATVILISDGRETCDLDPCVVAAELEAAGVNFTAHVIGFDIEDANDIAQLQCIADRTGGRYVSAKDSASLNSAMQEVVQEIRAESIQFVATLEPGGAPLTQGVSWFVTEVQADLEGKYPRVTQNGAPQAKIKLDNGTYRIVAKRGAASIAKVITIDDSTERVELVLGAGDILLQAALTAGGEPITQGVSWYVDEPTPDFEGKYKRVTQSGAPKSKFTLPAGDYRVTATKGSASATQVVQVRGGEQTAMLFNLDAAYIKTSAALAEDGPVITKGVNWAVHGTQQQLDGTYPRITQSGAPQATFTLPAGRYRVSAKKHTAMTVKEIELQAGDQISHKQSLNAGDIAAFATLSEGGEPISKRVSWKVTEPEPEFDGSYKRISQNGAAQWNFTISEGVYRLVAERGSASSHKQIEVISGSQQRIPLSLEAAVVVATPTSAGTELTRGVNWTVLTGGERVERTGAVQPTFTLPAGTYDIEASSRNPPSVGRLQLTLTPGEQKRIMVELEAKVGE